MTWITVLWLSEETVIWGVLRVPGSHPVATKEGHKDITVKTHGKWLPFIHVLNKHLLRAYARCRYTVVNEMDMGLMTSCGQQDLRGAWVTPRLSPGSEH